MKTIKLLAIAIGLVFLSSCIDENEYHYKKSNEEFKQLSELLNICKGNCIVVSTAFEPENFNSKQYYYIIIDDYDDKIYEYIGVNYNFVKNDTIRKAKKNLITKNLLK